MNRKPEEDFRVSVPLLSEDESAKFSSLLPRSRESRGRRNAAVAGTLVLLIIPVILVATIYRGTGPAAAHYDLSGLVDAVWPSATGDVSTVRGSASPATSFAPMVEMTSDNAWLFLQDKQHEHWRDEVQTDWQLKTDWRMARGIQAGTIGALDKQKTCLTYEDRYSNYANKSVDRVPRPPTAGARTAFVVAMSHKVLRAPLSVDWIKHLRAVITEVQLGSGIDVWLSIHMGEALSAVEEQAFLAQLPPELKGRTITYTTNQLFGMYVNNQKKIDALKYTMGLPGENHYTTSFFMDSPQGRQYDRVWWTESDVRQTGSWTAFFNHLNATIPKEMPPAYEWQNPRPSEFAEWDTSKLGPWQPDYFTTILIGRGSQIGAWNSRTDQAKAIYGEHTVKAFVHLWGMSRRFHNIMVNGLMEGKVVNLEYVMPSTASREGVPMWVSEPPAYSNPAIGHGYPTFGRYQKLGADPFYQQWHNDSGICRPGPTLLHAVKIWKSDKQF